MGHKIDKEGFSSEEIAEFKSRLNEETKLLHTVAKNGGFSNNIKQIGFELELTLLNHDRQPHNTNLEFVNAFNKPFLVTEVHESTIEINSDPFQLKNKVFHQGEQHLHKLVSQVRKFANKQKSDIISIGIFPTEDIDNYTESHMTNEARYHMMEKCLRKYRLYKPAKININKTDSLTIDIDSIACIGLLTAFQIHCRIGLSESARFYNASLIASAPLLACAGNSPYLFGKSL